MHHTSIRLLILSQATFLGGLALCFWFEPIAWFANIGVSYFGMYSNTLAAFATGFAVGSIFLVWATTHFPRHLSQLNKIAPFLRLIPFLLLGIVLTPYNSTPDVVLAHKLIADTLFALQLLLSLWLSRELGWPKFAQFLLGLQVLGMVIAALSLRNIVSWEVQGQLLFEIAFGVLLIRCIAILIDQNGTVDKPARLKAPRTAQQVSY